jgi:hypothetical protein
MAVSQAADLVESVIGQIGDTTTEQNLLVTADPSGEKMKALVWIDKNTVQVIEMPESRKIEDTDVIVKVTGSIVCGSDLHLLHGVVVEMQKGDILGPRVLRCS